MSNAPSFDRPLRIALWGPGSIGTAAIREIALLPHLELVAVFAYSDQKRGVDAGVLAGIEPLGVNATTDLNEFLDTEPDCVFYAARDAGDWQADNDLVMLLERGLDVVTVLPYQYPQVRQDGAFDKLDAAAKRGGATLYASGINPGFMFERLLMTATGLANGIEKVSLTEVVNVEHITGGAEFLIGMGFGMETASPEAVDMIARTVGNYLTPYLYSSAERMGLRVDRVEREDFHLPTPLDLDVPGLFTLKAGTAGLVSFRWTAYCDGQPRLSTQVKWYATDAMRPQEAQGHGDDFWLIEIDGRPAVRMFVELSGTLDGAREHPDNPSHVAMLATAIPALQAIPDVIREEPGVMIAGGPRFTWRDYSAELANTVS
jgi:hypothetical protein